MTVSAPTADNMPTYSYSKLQLLASGLYRIIEVLQSTIVTYESGVHITVSIHWVSRAPNLTQDGDKDTTDTSIIFAAKTEEQRSSDKEQKLKWNSWWSGLQDTTGKELVEGSKFADTGTDPRTTR